MRSKKTPGRLSQGAGLGRYLKEAFTFRWNMLLFFGGIAASFLSPWPDIAFPLVAAAELTYLAGVISIPKFRSAIDAKAHEENRRRPTLTKGERQTARTLADIVTSLSVFRIEGKVDQALANQADIAATLEKLIAHFPQPEAYLPEVTADPTTAPARPAYYVLRSALVEQIKADQSSGQDRDEAQRQSWGEFP